jgi:hypothetical protein
MVSRRATALAAGALVMLCLATPVTVCAMQPFSFYETLLAGLMAAETAVIFSLLWLAPALCCPGCERPFLRSCPRCAADGTDALHLR